jgi:streptomycin 6-kinase
MISRMAEPRTLHELEARWDIVVGEPWDTPEGSGGWIAPARRADGGRAVLKLASPHWEAEHEIAGLEFWDGDPTVRLLEADDGLHALLLERCEPGTVLRTQPEERQDEVIAGLLRCLWRIPAEPHVFRSLAEMTARWSDETLGQIARWPEEGLVRAGLELFRELPASAPARVLLATDLHAGNVLEAERAPWLVIDPKPFLGDPAYDATQHLFNCLDRMAADPFGTIDRFAALLGLDAERVRLWTFARAAAEPRGGWSRCRRFELARRLRP